MEGCGEGQQLGGVTSFPSWSLLPVRSCLLFPEAWLPPLPLGSWGEPQSHTSRHVRHCLGKVCFGIAGNKSCWYRFGSVSLPCWGQGSGLWGQSTSGVSSGSIHYETLRNGWMVGEAVSLEVGLFRKCPVAQKWRRWEDVEEARSEGGSLEPLSQHPLERK